MKKLLWYFILIWDRICMHLYLKELFTFQDIDGKDVPLKKFKNKVLLIVNVASQWYFHWKIFHQPHSLFFYVCWHLTWHSSVDLSGLTTANYTELSHIYEKYKTQGVAIYTEQCCVYLSFLGNLDWTLYFQLKELPKVKVVVPFKLCVWS